MKRVRRKYNYDPDAHQAAHRRRREPFHDLLSIPVREIDDEELEGRILDRLQTADLSLVAWWIASLRTKRGRPRGRRTELPTRARAAEWIKQQLKRSKRRWCREHGRERAPRAVTTEFVEELIAAAGKRYRGISAPFEVGEFLRDK